MKAPRKPANGPSAVITLPGEQNAFAVACIEIAAHAVSKIGCGISPLGGKGAR